MSKKFEDDEINNDLVKYVYGAAVNVFCNGIYVPTSDCGHPCGWDFVSFEMVDDNDSTDEIFVHEFEDYEVSNGFGSVKYIDKTLLEILKICHGQVAFELNQIDW